MPDKKSRLIASSSNLLLRKLSVADQMLLAPHIHPVAVVSGSIIAEAFGPVDAFYFPESVLVSLMERVGPQRTVEVALVGHEGMLGWPALLGCQLSSHLMVAQLSGGTLLRIESGAMRIACDRSRTLASALLRFVPTILTQMARAIASHLQDPVDRRIARWILMRHDRVGGDVIVVRHEEMGDSLNVRRASITDGLHILEGELLVRCNRGRILVRDREALERFAGTAYGLAEAYYRTLIAPFGKGDTRLASLVGPAQPMSHKDQADHILA